LVGISEIPEILNYCFAITPATIFDALPILGQPLTQLIWSLQFARSAVLFPDRSFAPGRFG